MFEFGWRYCRYLSYYDDYYILTVNNKTYERYVIYGDELFYIATPRSSGSYKDLILAKYDLINYWLKEEREKI